jgi:hypothetical protein
MIRRLAAITLCLPFTLCVLGMVALLLNVPTILMPFFWIGMAMGPMPALIGTVGFVAVVLFMGGLSLWPRAV